MSGTRTIRSIYAARRAVHPLPTSRSSRGCARFLDAGKPRCRDQRVGSPGRWAFPKGDTKWSTAMRYLTMGWGPLE